MLLLIFLPLLRNLLFWAFVWQTKEYRLDRFLDFFSTKEGKKAFFNKISLIEILILTFGFISIFSGILIKEYYYLVLTLLALENFLFFFKLFSGTLKTPKFTSRMKITFFIALILNSFLVFSFYGDTFTTSLLFGLLVLQSVIFGASILAAHPLSNYLRSKKISQAKEKIVKFQDLKKVGVTGSYGKSSVKESLATILSESFDLLKTPKNQNTPLGISNTILNFLDKSYDFFICEMGAYKKGEIKELSEIVDHKYAFLTGINNQHLALFGSQKNIIEGKCEILEKVRKNKGKAYINFDSDFTYKLDFDGIEVISYGITNPKVDVLSQIETVKNGKTFFKTKYKDEIHEFETGLIGNHNVLNLTGVIAFCLDVGMSKEKIQDGISKLKSPKQNLEIVKKTENLILIDDTYNSNFDGILAACESLEFFEDYKKILVLDDILELGKESEKVHFEIGKSLASFNFKEIYLVGKNFAKEISDGLKNKNFSGKIYFQKDLKLNEEERNLVLFEGRESGKIIKK